MSTQTIIESGMTFGPYQPGRCFHIEKSNCYAAIQEYVPMAEFLLLRGSEEDPVMWIVEAKSSTPHLSNRTDFENFIAEIREKLINALSLGWACCLVRHRQAGAELPEGFRELHLSQVDVKFVLVLKGHQDEWLPPQRHPRERGDLPPILPSPQRQTPPHPPLSERMVGGWGL